MTSQQIENDLYTLIKKMRPRTGLYVSEKSITALWHFVAGYHTASMHKNLPDEKLIPRWELFNEFVKRKTHFHESTSGWKNMILAYCDGDEEKGLDTFFEFFDAFLKNEELDTFLPTLIPKNKFDWDFDKAVDILWYNYQELKPIIPKLLEWLQDINWPVAQPIASVLVEFLPDILAEISPILEGNDSTWKYHVLDVFFIQTKSPEWVKIKPLIAQLAYNPSPQDRDDEVDILALEIVNHYYQSDNSGEFSFLFSNWVGFAKKYSAEKTSIYEWQNHMDARRLIDEKLALIKDNSIDLASKLAELDALVKANTFETNACIWGAKNEKKHGYNRKTHWYYYRANPFIVDSENNKYTKYQTNS